MLVTRVWRRLCMLFLAAIDVHGLLLVIYLLLRLITGDRLWPVELANNLIQWLLPLSLIFLPLGLYLRRWHAVALHGINAAAFLLLYGVFFLPAFSSPPCADDQATVLRVMTANAAADTADPATFAAVLAESGADVIAIQELGPSQAAAFAPELTALYPYRALYPLLIPGKGLLSRYPIIDDSGPFYLQTSLPHMRATLDVKGIALTVIIAHPPRPLFGSNGYFVHPNYTDDVVVLADMAVLSAPAILLGDFNTSDQSHLYRPLPEAGLTDAFRAEGWGFGATFPAKLGPQAFIPVVRIDYIWLTDGLYARKAWVGSVMDSDHRPVLAEVVLCHPD